MRYRLAFEYVLGRPGGWRNLLLLTVCSLVPPLGQIVQLGYQAEVAERLDRDPAMRDYPDFTFDRLLEYFHRGLWPFLVQILVLAAGLAVAFAPGVALFLAGVYLDRPVTGSVAAALLFLAGLIGSLLVGWPWTLHAELTGTFDPAAGWRFVRDFWRVLGLRAYVSILVLSLIGTAVILVGLLLCIVGHLPAVALVQMAGQHLLGQHYRLYRKQGGSPLGGAHALAPAG
jgi:hypothetical protein